MDTDEKLRVVETALRLYGKAAARRLWADLGLPPVKKADGYITPSSEGRRTVERFVEDCLEGDACGTLSALVVYAAYRSWTVTVGLPEMTWVAFGRAMAETRIDKVRGRHVVYRARLKG